jgi:hypothetical protein
MAWVITFGAVMIGWVFFRAPSLERVQVILTGMAGLNGLDWSALPYSIGGNRLRLILPALALVWWCPNRQAIMGGAGGVTTSCHRIHGHGGEHSAVWQSVPLPYFLF